MTKTNGKYSFIIYSKPLLTIKNIKLQTIKHIKLGNIKIYKNQNSKLWWWQLPYPIGTPFLFAKSQERMARF